MATEPAMRRTRRFAITVLCAMLLHVPSTRMEASVSQPTSEAAPGDVKPTAQAQPNVQSKAPRQPAIASPKPKESAGIDTDEHEIATQTKYLAWATFALAAVGAFQLRYLIKTDRNASRSAQAAADSARAAQASVEAAERTAERELRAYLSITNCEYSVDAKAKCYRAKYRLKNVGQTPAFNVSVRGYAFISAEKPSGDDLLSKLDGSVAEPKSVLFPDQLAVGNRYGEALVYDPNQDGGNDPLKKKANRLYIIVEVRYTDGFGKQRFTRRCRRTAHAKKYLSTYELGNDAS